MLPEPDLGTVVVMGPVVVTLLLSQGADQAPGDLPLCAFNWGGGAYF